MDGARLEHRSLREADDRRRRVAVVASLVLHAIVLLLVLRLQPALRSRPAPPETVTVQQTLRLVRKPRAIRRPIVAARPRPVPHAAPRPQTASRMTRRPVVPKTILPTVAPERPIAVPPKAPARVATRPAPHALRRPATSGATATAPAPLAKSRLSGAQIARIEGDLGDSIARDREGVDPLRVPPGAPATPKHFTPDFSGLTTGIDHEHGLCDPIKDWTEDGWNYYYVACNVQTESGLFKRESVPWPIRFDPKDDPFNGTAHDRDRAVAMPLPGWRLPPGETVSDGLREYAHEHGVEL